MQSSWFETIFALPVLTRSDKSKGFITQRHADDGNCRQDSNKRLSWNVRQIVQNIEVEISRKKMNGCLIWMPWAFSFYLICTNTLMPACVGFLSRSLVAPVNSLEFQSAEISLVELSWLIIESSVSYPDSHRFVEFPRVSYLYCILWLISLVWWQLMFQRRNGI